MMTHVGERLGDVPLGYWRYYLNNLMPGFKAHHPGLYRYARIKVRAKQFRGILKNHIPLEGDE